MLIPYKTICEKYNIRPTGILHIGGHWAEEASDYYSNGVQRTIWVEANLECMMNLIANLAPYPDHIVFNDCCTDTDGEEVTFNISNNQGQSSSILQLEHHKMAHPEVHYIAHQTLRTKRVDTLFRDNDLSIQDYQFINIDIQGAELLALKGMGELLNHVSYLYLEINTLPLYTGCALIQDIDEYVEQFGFKRVETSMSGNHGWGDALYIKQ